MMLCELLWVATAWAVNMRLVEESVMAGAWIVMAFRSGICQRPRPYVPARSMPLRPSPVGQVRCGCKRGHRRVRQAGSERAPAVGGGTSCNCLGREDARVHRNVDGVGI